MTGILDRLEASLRDFRPTTYREFVALQACQRLNDVANLARYLNASKSHSNKVLLEAARLAMERARYGGRPASSAFFEILEQFGKEES